jgi:GNAT superfamily N-acetyltransferase
MDGVRVRPVLQSQDAARHLSGMSEVAELWRVEGPIIFLRHALQRYGPALFNHLYVFEFDLARAAKLEPLGQILPPGVTTQLFRSADQIDPLTTLLAQAGPTHSAEQRMLRGDVAILAMAGEKLVGYAWATFKERWISEIRATIVPRDDEVLQYDKRILPKWRGKGMQYALSVAILPYLADLGYRRTLNWVDAVNTRSLKNQRRLGKRKVADIISVPPLRIMRVRNCSPADGVKIEKRPAV